MNMNSKFYLLFIIVAFICISFESDAQTLVKQIKVDNIQYALLSDGTAVLIDGKKAVGNVTVPAQVNYGGNNYSVTKIGSNAFSGESLKKENTKLTGIVIPYGITSIEKNAFEYCGALQRVEMPESLINIGNYAFYDCRSLNIVNIPNSVTTIGKWAFRSCEKLQKIVIPNSVTLIDEEAFSSCRSLTEIVLPDNEPKIKVASYYLNKYLEGRPFHNCDKIAKVSGNTIPYPSYINDILPYCTFIRDIYPQLKKEYRHTAKIVYKDGKPGLVTDVGEVLVSFGLYDAIEDFGAEMEGLARVSRYYSSSNTQYYGYINKLGKAVVKCQYDSLGAFNEFGLAKFRRVETIDLSQIYRNKRGIEKHLMYGYVNKDGKEFATQLNHEVDDFDNTGLVKVYDKWYDIYGNKYDYLALAQQAVKATVTARPSVPPVLNIVPNSIMFADASGNKAIDANEVCKIILKVSNSGKGAGNNCIAKVSTSTPGISVKDKRLPSIPSGKTVDVEIPVTSSLETVNGEADFKIEIYEPNGFGCDPTILTVQTRAYEAPYIRMTDYAISGTANGIISKRSAFDLQLLVQNVKHGKAEDVEVNIQVPNNVWVMGDGTKTVLGTLEGGSGKEIKYEMMVNNNYTLSTIPVKVIIREKHGKYAESQTINLPLEERLSGNHIQIAASSVEKRENIAVAHISGKTEVSDVDINIPQGEQANNNTFAVIISNENYEYVKDVPFAYNDGTVFKTYCQKTLGIPDKHIRYVKDATLGDLLSQIDWITKISEAHNGEATIIFYYAGHGIPDESSRDAYLLPIDGNGSNTRVCYKLSELYSSLSGCNAKLAVVLMDACFSGAERSGDMLASARGVAIKAKTEVPSGNLIVLSAAQGDETAYPYKEKGHGMFTYFLLKKLQQSKGNTTLGELYDYITKEVSRESLINNNKRQTPSVIPSMSYSNNWREIRLGN